MKQRIGLRNQAGMTIIEIMIALVIGLILLGGMLQVYLGSKTTYGFSEGLGRMQEDSRYAFDLLAKDIRMAGFIPCGPVETTASVIIDEPGDDDWWLPFFTQPIRGYEGGLGEFPSAIDSAALDQSSDALLILRGGSLQASISRYDEANQRFILQRDLGANWIQPGHLMVACDQNHASFFQAAAIDVGSDSSVPGNVTRISTDTVAMQPGNCTTALGYPAPGDCDSPGQSGSSYPFGEDGFISDYQAVIYHIRTSSVGQGRSLYREYINVNNGGSSVSIESDPEELITSVESMQINYGLDLEGNDGVADRYLAASDVDDDDWTRVVTVSIGLLFASDNGVTRQPDTKTYTISGTTIAPAGTAADLNHPLDRRLRFAVTTLVQMRNTDS